MKVLVLSLVFSFSVFAMPPKQAFNIVRSLVAQVQLNAAGHEKMSTALEVLKDLASKEAAKKSKAAKKKKNKKVIADYLEKKKGKK